jgi:hypothetical protein
MMIFFSCGVSSRDPRLVDTVAFPAADPAVEVVVAHAESARPAAQRPAAKMAIAANLLNCNIRLLREHGSLGEKRGMLFHWMIRRTIAPDRLLHY